MFNILNTVAPAYVAKLIEHANEQRHSAQAAAMEEQCIEMTSNWADKLHSAPFISRKYYFKTYFLYRRQGQDDSLAESVFEARSVSAKAAEDRDCCFSG